MSRMNNQASRICIFNAMTDDIFVAVELYILRIWLTMVKEEDILNQVELHVLCLERTCLADGKMIAF